MNTNDFKSLLISIVAGVAVNIIWAIGTAPAPTSVDHLPAAKWVLQLPPRPPAALPGYHSNGDPPIDLQGQG